MKIGGRPEPVVGEMTWDDLWLVVICQSNSEIAGSPRNIFRYSLQLSLCGVERLDRLSRLCRGSPTKLRIRKVFFWGVRPARISESGREEKSPDFHLRSLNDC